ncbi:hypothetical protein SVIOM342S_06338 [Streptomyces violaceorubidus]
MGVVIQSFVLRMSSPAVVRLGERLLPSWIVH